MRLPPTRLRRFEGVQDYAAMLRAMRDFTAARGPDTADEVWMLQHSPVYTLGFNGKPEHILDAGDIPVLPSDRGGQVTYHGPGQWVFYVLMDLRRRGWGVRQLVQVLEQSVIDLLATEGVDAQRRHAAPGVYVNDAKIAALGLRIRSGYSYHGLCLNVDMNLSPFARINPCGYADMAVTQLRDCIPAWDMAVVAERWWVGMERLLAKGHPKND